MLSEIRYTSLRSHVSLTWQTQNVTKEQQKSTVTENKDGDVERGPRCGVSGREEKGRKCKKKLRCLTLVYQLHIRNAIILYGKWALAKIKI